MAFYHTYRPQNLQELIITQKIVSEQLHSAILKKSISHAYLFTGSHGIGKTSTARILAKIANCLDLDISTIKKNKEPLSVIPCNACTNCLSITKGNMIDVVEMDAASNRGVDEIRSLKEIAQLMPVSGKIKVYIIDEVHMLTNEAFNALLKILEEPPQSVMFILCTTELVKVPRTIQSRCVSFAFMRPGLAEIISVLQSIASKEGLNIDSGALELLAKLSGGAYRDAVKLLEQLSFHSKNISLELVEKYCLFSSVLNGEQMVLALSGRNISSSLEIISQLYESNANFPEFTKLLIENIRLILIAKVRNEKTELFATYSVYELTDLIDILNKAYAQFKNSPIASLPLEIAVLKFFSIKGTSPVVVSSTIHSTSRSKGGVNAHEIDPVITQFENTKPVVKKTETVVTVSEIVTTMPDIEPALDQVAAKNGNTEIDLIVVQDRWNELVRFLKTYNASMAAFVRSCKPIEVDNKFIIMETQYTLHKDLIEKPKNRVMIEQVLFELFGVNLHVKVNLRNTKLNAKNIENVKEVQGDDLMSAVAEIFGV
ncbi:MAG: DNA polymerase III subunit gamma/tau [bacterium]|nr:DNA polymerase III subunit gamma/tau [bacterium]